MNAIYRRSLALLIVTATFSQLNAFLSVNVALAQTVDAVSEDLVAAEEDTSYRPELDASSATAARTASGPADLELTGLLVSPGAPRNGQPFTISFALYNPTGQDIVIGRTGIGLRGPDACAPGNPWTAHMPEPQPEGWSNHVVQAGQTRWFNREYATYLAPGHYIVEPVYHCAGCSNPYPAFRNSKPLWFDVLYSDGSRQTPNCLVVSQPLTITPSDADTSTAVTASFSLRNNSFRTIVLERVIAAGRRGYDWDAPNADFPNARNQPVTLSPGEEFHYSESTTFGIEGVYFAEPWRMEAGDAGTYYTGGIWGGNRKQFNVSLECPGLYLAEYFDNVDLAGEPAFTWCENWPIDHSWGYDGPGLGLPADNFSVRWSGRANLEETFYDFYYRADDGMRAWLYNTGYPLADPNLFDRWTDPPYADQVHSRSVRPAGEYDVIVEYAERGGFAEAKFRWEARPRTGQIVGRIADASGRGIEGVRVDTASTGRHTQETDSGGNFSFSGLPIRTEYDLYVVKQGYVFDPYRKTVYLPSSEPQYVLFTGKSESSSSNSIVGAVTDADGKPMVGVPIRAKSGDNEYQVQTSGSDGIYTLDDLPPGTYEVTPIKRDYLFGPHSKTVTVPSFEALFVSFRAFPCKAPSGLNICDLQPGDILLQTGGGYPAGSVDYWWATIGGTYYTHSALYLGVIPDPNDPEHVAPRIAEAQGDVPGDEDDVWEVELLPRSFWTGRHQIDWAVVRPRTSPSAKEEAIAYARKKAAAEGVTFVITAPGDELRAPDLNDETSFYCSKLVYKAYQKAGVKVDERIRIGELASRLGWVTPEDLYWGSPRVQKKQFALDRIEARMFFSVWSPAHLTLFDPQDRRTGYNPDGPDFNEIPNAWYSGPDAVVESINVAGAEGASGWQIVATGFETGDYTLELGYLHPGVELTTVESTTEAGQVDVIDVPPPMYRTHLPSVLSD